MPLVMPDAKEQQVFRKRIRSLGKQQKTSTERQPDARRSTSPSTNGGNQRPHKEATVSHSSSSLTPSRDLCRSNQAATSSSTPDREPLRRSNQAANDIDNNNNDKKPSAAQTKPQPRRSHQAANQLRRSNQAANHTNKTKTRHYRNHRSDNTPLLLSVQGQALNNRSDDLFCFAFLLFN